MAVRPELPLMTEPNLWPVVSEAVPAQLKGMAAWRGRSFVARSCRIVNEQPASPCTGDDR